MEVCIDSVESAINAEKGVKFFIPSALQSECFWLKSRDHDMALDSASGDEGPYAGAVRVELCANLMEGGTTPSTGLLKVIKSVTTIPVFVMVRPRGGDFLYSQYEFDVMREEIYDLKLAGADGIVLGILKEDGTVDMERCADLIGHARPLPVTFHRAIDMANDVYTALECVISLGCERVLTSGGESTVLEGLPVITRMIQQAKGRITVVPGGGITERNIERIMEQCKAKEFHASARSTQESAMTFRKTNISMGASFSPLEFSKKVTDTAKIKTFISMSSTKK